MARESNLSNDPRLSDLLESVSQLESRVHSMRQGSDDQPQQQQMPSQQSGATPNSLAAAAAEIKSRQASLASGGADLNHNSRSYEKEVEGLRSQIKYELDQLKGDISTSIAQNIPSNLQSELGALRSELANMRNSVAAGIKGNRSQTELRNLAQGINALQDRTPVEKTDIVSLHQEINDLRSMVAAPKRDALSNDLLNKLISQIDSTHVAVESLPSTRHLSSVENRIDQLGSQLQGVLAERARMDTSMLATLESRLADLQSSVTATANQDVGLDASLTQQGLERIDSRLGQLADLVNAQTASNNAAHADADSVLSKLDHMGDRLSAIAQMHPAESHHVDFLASRIDDMMGRLDTIDAKQPDHSNELSTLLSRVGEISHKIDSGSQSQSIPALEAHFQELSDQIDRLAPKTDNEDMGTMAQNLAALADKVDLVASNGPQDQTFGNLEQQIAAMHAKLDNLPNSESGFSALDDGATNRLERQIASLADHLEQSTQNIPDTSRLSDLENQISNISSLLADTSEKAAAFSGSLNSSLAQAEGGVNIPQQFASLENKLSNQSAAMLSAVKEAAREAAQDAVAASGQSENATILAQLANDLNILQQTAKQSQDGTRQTFDAVHTTLEKVVDRLESLEVSAAIPHSQQQPVMAAAQPQMAMADATPAAPSDGFRGINPLLKGLMSGKKPEAEMPAAPQPDFAELPAVNAPSVEPNMPDAGFGAPLEPGQLPDASARLDDIPKSPADGMDFIAAARRAAKTAATETSALAGSELTANDALEAPIAEESVVEKRDPEKNILARLRRPVAIASGAILLALAVYQYGPVIAEPYLGTAQTDETTIEMPAPATEAGDDQTSLTAPLDGADKTVRQVDGNDTAENSAAGPTDESSAVAMAKPASPDNPTSTAAPTFAPKPDAALGSYGIPMPSGKIGSPALRQAAVNGNPAAMFEVGLRYNEGKLLEKDLNKAAEWYQRAADSDLAPAQFRLASLYEKGTGVEKSLPKAISLYKKAADAGNARAMHNLAVLYTGPEGGPKVQEATELFKKAGSLGVQDSQFNLGILYGRGMGVELDLKESYKWFSLAARNGDKDAADKRDQVANAMLPEDLDKARLAVEAWKPAELDKRANTVSIPSEWVSNKGEKTAQSEIMTAPKLVSAAQAKPLDVVVTTQKTLLKLGYKIGTADGKAGPKTERAIRDLQRQLGLTIDGKPSIKLLEAVRTQLT